MTKIADTKDKRDFLLSCQEILDDGKCEDIKHYAWLEDYLVKDVIIATANSEIHCRSVAQKIEKEMMEGEISFISSLRNVHPKLTPSHKWVAIDCEEYSTMIHVMTTEERSYYRIDELMAKMAGNIFIFEPKNEPTKTEQIFGYDNFEEIKTFSNDLVDEKLEKKLTEKKVRVKKTPAKKTEVKTADIKKPSKATKLKKKDSGIMDIKIGKKNPTKGVKIKKSDIKKVDSKSVTKKKSDKVKTSRKVTKKKDDKNVL